MPHRSYRAEHTHSEIQDMFADALGRFGGVADGAEIARMHGISVNGSALGSSHPRLHKPYSNHFAKDENESVAVARMLVQLDLESGVADVVERDKPDRQVLLRDGSSIFVEARVIENGQIREARFLEDANHILLSNARRDNVLGQRLAQLNVTISLHSFSIAIPMHQLLKDTQEFIKGILTAEGANESIPAIYPALFASRGYAFWKPKVYEQSAVLQKTSSWSDADYVGKELAEAIAEKRLRARGYDPICAPLWLLLSVVDIRQLPETLRSSALTVLAGCDDVEPFSRIVITAPGMKAIVHDAPL